MEETVLTEEQELEETPLYVRNEGPMEEIEL